jgi:hypothetical protein
VDGICNFAGLQGLGIGYSRGHFALTQFFDEREEYWTLGFGLPF